MSIYILKVRTISHRFEYLITFLPWFDSGFVSRVIFCVDSNESKVLSLSHFTITTYSGNPLTYFNIKANALENKSQKMNFLHDTCLGIVFNLTYYSFSLLTLYAFRIENYRTIGQRSRSLTEYPMFTPDSVCVGSTLRAHSMCLLLQVRLSNITTLFTHKTAQFYLNNSYNSSIVSTSCTL